MRRLYAAVLTICCAYCIASIPIVIALAIALVAGLFLGSTGIGPAPSPLAWAVATALAVSLAVALRSLLVRGRDEDPGDRLDLRLHPRLRHLLQEVADRVGTPVVDSVYLTPGTDFAVMERGGLLRHWTRRSERCLILGVGGLEGLDLAAFQSVLAHEYGHFSNRDTAGGGFALTVRLSLVTLAGGLARGRATRWYNPLWLFVHGFYLVFLRISQGASRLQEVLADRRAAVLYGAEAFQRGLRHAIESTVRFGMHTEAVFDEVIEQSRPLDNLYRYQPARLPDEQTAHRRIAQVLQAKPSPFDSHPSPADRLAWVAAWMRAGELTAQPASSGTGGAVVPPEPVWNLFNDRDAIERRMTALARATIERRHGLVIPAAP